MDPSQAPKYDHTQTGPWHLLLMALGVVFLSVGWLAPGDPVADIVLPVSAWAMALLAMSFRSLTVIDRGDHLALRFGPVPLFRKRVPYADLEQVERGRLSILDGWGIHYSLRGGWVWSMWGFDCVVVRYRGRTLRIGTDDADNLVGFLNQQRPDPGT